MLKVKQVREKEKKNNLSLINERWVNVDGLMHLIRANLVCVCVFFNFFFFENLKKIQSCPILHLPYKKTFHFLGFLYSWFFCYFLSNTLLKCLFWTFCFLKILKKNTIHLRLATRQISCSHAVDNLSVITAVGNCILPASLSKIPIPSLSLLWGIFSFLIIDIWWWRFAALI